MKDGKCSECGNQTIMFWGKGKNMQYRICPRYKEEGHKTEEEIERILYQIRMQINPSGRLA